MTPDRRREFDALLPQLRDGALPPGVLLDWLEENEADLALWCLAWRDCPEPAEAFQQRWAGWLREREPERYANPGHDSHGNPGNWGGGNRWAMLRVQAVNGDHMATHGLAWAERDRKRRVLALFPEVVVLVRQVRCVLGDRRYHHDPAGVARLYDEQARAELLTDWPHVAVTHTDRETELGLERTWAQEVRAPDLIPPDPPEYGPSPLAGAYRAFMDERAIDEARRAHWAGRPPRDGL